ncbi:MULTISPECIES: hypothetical protein [Pantoea]|uniref:hypothetical protein n=1 Tax=Pantoea TaxID=53335 RepID=UPI000B50087B|nr:MULTISPECIES: hypothetical protein [Pantoea]OWS74259.1 hypothetical protein CBW22_17980 [Pantoea sp. VS1]UYP75626.1 hypothetical protein OF384_22180 [Pantoea dispersa]
MVSNKDHTGVSALTGTPQEIQGRLSKSHASHVVAITFDHPGDALTLRNLSENLSAIASSMFAIFQQRQRQESLEQLASAMLPRVPASPHLLKEAAMLLEARNAVLESGNWLSAAEVAQLAGLSSTNPSAQPNKWKKSGQIFAINHNGIDYFPDYGLDRDTHFRPVKPLAQILRIFAGHKDSWAIALWFLSNNSFLAGKRPQDLLLTEAQRVIDAALDEMEGITHG